MADRFEKSLPEFWKKCGPKTLEVSASISLVLFITLNTELFSLRSQTNDLHRFRNELMDKESQLVRDAEMEDKANKAKSAVEKNLAMWRDSIRKIEQAMEALEKDRRETLQAFEKSVGEFRVEVIPLENQPTESAATVATPNPRTSRR
jgi:biopolymer transport protein ExbB/TolQ